MTTSSTKKALKSIVVIIVIFGMLALYILPGLIPQPQDQQAPTPEPTNTFMPPVGAPSIKGPSAPPGQSVIQ